MPDLIRHPSKKVKRQRLKGKRQKAKGKSQKAKVKRQKSKGKSQKAKVKRQKSKMDPRVSPCATDPGISREKPVSRQCPLLPLFR